MEAFLSAGRLLFCASMCNTEHSCVSTPRAFPREKIFFAPPARPGAFPQEEFFSRSRTPLSLPPRGRCRACEADEVPPGERPCDIGIFSCLARCISEQKTANFVQQKLEISYIAFVRAFPRGEGAEPARRMRCHRAKGPAT